MGCTTIGQIEDDVRIAAGFRPLDTAEIEKLRQRAKPLHGPATEDRKKRTDAKSAGGNG